MIKRSLFIFLLLACFNSFSYSLVERGVAIGQASASKKIPGIQYQNVNSYSSQPGDAQTMSENTMANTSILSFFSKKSILGGQYLLTLVPPSFGFEKGKLNKFDKYDSPNKKWEGGSYNPFGLTGIIWDLPYGWGLSNSAGGFFPWSGSEHSYHGWVFVDALAMGHYKDLDHNFTGLLFIGVPGVDSRFHKKTNNNFLNFNLTASRTFKEKYELGGILYYTKDIGEPAHTLLPIQSQLAFGGLLGFYQKHWYVQAWYGHDVSQTNYTSLHSIGFVRFTIELVKF